MLGGTPGVLHKYPWDTLVVPWGYPGGVPLGYSGDTPRIPWGYPGGILVVPWEYPWGHCPRGTQGYLGGTPRVLWGYQKIAYKFLRVLSHCHSEACC